VIIYSFTIQQQYQLDFLTANSFDDNGRIVDRKLNVALTRARKQLLLTGNPKTMEANPVFKELLAYVHTKKHAKYPNKNK
jgi:superfamily I DNA and/or RNA helicase